MSSNYFYFYLTFDISYAIFTFSSVTAIHHGRLLGYLEQRRSITFLFHSSRLPKAISVPSGQLSFAAGTPQRVCSQLVAARSLFAEFISGLDSKDVWIDSNLLEKREKIINVILIIFISSITFFVSLFPLVLIILLFYSVLFSLSLFTYYALQSVQLIWFTSCETEGILSNRPLTIFISLSYRRGTKFRPYVST